MSGHKFEQDPPIIQVPGVADVTIKFLCFSLLRSLKDFLQQKNQLSTMFLAPKAHKKINNKRTNNFRKLR